MDIERAKEATLKTCIGGGLDEQRIAEFCISFEPSNPADWTFRHDRIHSEAKRLVEIHAVEIHAAAVQLFHTGAVTLPGNPEDDEFFKPQTTGV